jgi:hypothetical protein
MQKPCGNVFLNSFVDASMVISKTSIQHRAHRDVHAAALGTLPKQEHV